MFEITTGDVVEIVMTSQVQCETLKRIRNAI